MEGDNFENVCMVLYIYVLFLCGDPFCDLI